MAGVKYLEDSFYLPFLTSQKHLPIIVFYSSSNHSYYDCLSAASNRGRLLFKGGFYLETLRVTIHKNSNMKDQFMGTITNNCAQIVIVGTST